MPLRFTNRILEHLAHQNYRPASINDLATQLRVEDDERETFDQAIEQLTEAGRIVRGNKGDLLLPGFPDELTGIFRLNPRGFGFVEPDHPYREGDLFIPPGSTRDAVSRDRVRAQVNKGGKNRGKGKGPAGRIVEVLERGQTKFVGTLIKKRGKWLVEPDGRSLHDPVMIRDPHAKNAKQGDKVVIELLHYPDKQYVAEGVITQVLGGAGEPDVETQAVIVSHGLRTDFPPDAIEQASNAARTFGSAEEGPWPGREDLTEAFIFTIDPPDAKDFDDAISIQHDEKKNEWTLGVHIADVANFVKIDSALDEEAKARGNSVYLPRLVLPMLPETLSNGVCSLQEGVIRFAKSAFIRYDKKGKVLKQWFSSSVIRSAKRLTYLEAQALIEGDNKEAEKHTRAEPDYCDELIKTLQKSNTLANILRKRRMNDGMMVLDLPEVDLVFDDNGHVIDAVPEDDAFTHTIIEMFMVEANEALARLFVDLQTPLIRRIHPEPQFEDLSDLEMYARAAHYNLPDHPTAQDISALLNATRDSPAVKAIHFAVLRTFTKATYSPALIGHFGLASEHYTHFTSPIRRYPDLTVHRALQAYLDFTDNGRQKLDNEHKKAIAKKLAKDERVHDEAELITLGRHCSETEVEAEQAERELREYLVLQFLKEHHLGDEFNGVVTGVAGHGVFVSLERFLIDGRVAIDELPASDGNADRWSVDDKTGRLVAKRSGMSIGIGDVVRVQIARIDLGTRHLDLLLTRMAEQKRKKPSRRKHKN